MTNQAELHELIRTWASVVSALSLVVALFSYFLAKKAQKAIYESKRREHAVELVSKWSRHISREHLAAAQIVIQSPDDVIAKIVAKTPIQLPSELQDDIEVVIGRALSEHEWVEGKIAVGKSEVISIRFRVYQYLNELETTLLSWRLGIVDRAVMEEQFSELRNPLGPSDNTLKRFRNLSGGYQTFPSIALFCKELVPQSEARKPIA